MERLSVVSPVGLPDVAPGRAARRLGELNGATLGEIWNGVFKGSTTFPLIRKLLQDRYPRLTIIPYTEFPHLPGSDHPAEQWQRARAVAALARDKGCDAVITGNGA